MEDVEKWKLAKRSFGTAFDGKFEESRTWTIEFTVLDLATAASPA